MRPIRTIAALAATALLATACSGDDESGGPGDGAPVAAPDLQLASSLQPVESCDDLQTWAADELAPRVGAWGFGNGGPITLEGDVRVMEDQAGAAELSPSAPETSARADAEQHRPGRGPTRRSPTPTCRSRASTSPTS